MKKLNLNLFIADLMERDNVLYDTLFTVSKKLKNEIQKQLNGLKYE